MSTIRVDNLQASDGLSPAFPTSGVAKGIWEYNQNTPALPYSENLSSMTDNSAGDHTANLSNNMSAATYAWLGSNVGYTDTNEGSRRTVCKGGSSLAWDDIFDKTTSTITIQAVSAGTSFSDAYSWGTLHGDLA